MFIHVYVSEVKFNGQSNGAKGQFPVFFKFWYKAKFGNKNF